MGQNKSTCLHTSDDKPLENLEENVNLIKRDLRILCCEGAKSAYLSRYSIKAAGVFRILLSEDSLRETELMEHMFLKCIVAVNTLTPGERAEQVTFMNGTE